MVLFEVDELIVSRVAEVFVEPDPLCGVEERLAREGPALKVEELLLVVVALEHDVPVFADTLNLGEGRLQLEQPQVVQAAEGEDEIEVLVAPWIAILCA